MTQKIKEISPKGIDMNFENVGGMHFEGAMGAMAKGGRTAVCGKISAYNEAESTYENLNIGQMIYTSQRIEGFVAIT